MAQEPGRHLAEVRRRDPRRRPGPGDLVVFADRRPQVPRARSLALIIGVLAGVGTALVGLPSCWRARGPVRARADVRADPIGRPRRPSRAVHAIPHGCLGGAVLPGHSAGREQRLGTSNQRRCRSTPARSHVYATGWLATRLGCSAGCSPYRWLVCCGVLLGGTYRNVVVERRPQRQLFPIPRFRRSARRSDPDA
jgi:hypothetical protein